MLLEYDMSNKEFLGLNCQIIPRNTIPYTEELYDCDVIKNSNKYCLMYRKDCNGFFLITDDPSNFLPNNERFSQWIKL